jgi:hypothetical protein
MKSFIVLMSRCGMRPQHLFYMTKGWLFGWVTGYRQWISWETSRNLNEFLATFYFLQILQVYAGCSGATCIRMWDVVVQKAYVRGQYWCRVCTSSKKGFFRRAT